MIAAESSVRGDGSGRLSHAALGGDHRRAFQVGREWPAALGGGLGGRRARGTICGLWRGPTLPRPSCSLVYSPPPNGPRGGSWGGAWVGPSFCPFRGGGQRPRK